MNNGSRNTVSDIFNGFIYLALFIAVLVFSWKSHSLFLRLLSPVQVQQEEAVNVEFGRVLALGHSLYPDVRLGGPYLHCSYPPFFPYLESKLLKLTSNPWLPGRWLALSGYFGCGLLMALACWRRWGLNPWAILLPLFLWLNPTWATWGSMVRLDTPILFINFSSFLILLWITEQKEGDAKWYFWVMAGLLNGTAILMKPSAVTLTLSLILWALWKRRLKDGLLFFLASFGLVFVFYSKFQLESQGLYGLHTIQWTAVGFSFERFSDFILHGFLKEAGWLTALVFLTLVFKKTALLLKLQLLFSFLSIASLCRYGSAENYYMEFILYGLFAVGEGWGNKEEWGKTKEHSWVSWVCAVLVLTGITVFATSPEPAVPSNLEIKMKESVLSIYQQGEYHLALDNDLPLMAGKPIWYQPTGMLSMFQTNVWDPSPLLRDIQNHKFATIEFYDMPHQYLYPPIVEQAVLRNYHIHWKAFGRVWYVPNLN